MKDMMVYTQRNGQDHLSPGGPVAVPVLSEVPSSSNWRTLDLSSLGVNATTFSSSNGLCLGAPLTPDTYGGWYSPYGYVSLTQNAVYRFRLSMDAGSTPLAAGTTPFWDFVIDNVNGDDQANTQQKYSADFMILDNEGGATAVQNNPTYDFWYTPAAVTAADWNDPTTGEFQPSFDAYNDMRLQFRVLDTKNNANNADLDAGTLCLTNINVVRYDINQMSVDQNLMNDTNLTADTSGSQYSVGSIFGTANTTVTFSGGNLTIAPNTAGSAGTAAWDVEVIGITPGDTNNTTSDPNSLPDNWPIAWESNQLLRGTVSMQSATVGGDTNPPDGVSVIFDGVTSEYLAQSIIYASTNTIGLPKSASATDYQIYYDTMHNSNTTLTNGNRLRLSGQLLLSPNVQAGGSAHNVNGVIINSFKVDKMVSPN
jgi:hypothetical protein